ncbi:MAG: hypothetical protein ACRC41_02760 [Sarcina sp.]
MKKIFCIGLITVAALSFIACGNKDKNETAKQDTSVAVAENTIDQNSNNENNENTASKENEETSIENTENVNKETSNHENKETEKKTESKAEESKTETSESKKPVTKPDSETNKPVSPKPETVKPEPTKPETETNQTERVFNLYYKDVAQNDIVVSAGQVKTYGLGVADNIREILNTISYKFFNGQLLSLKTIEDVGNKKIAVIDLVGNKWTNTFQGSAGASAAEYNLITNILQREYNGYWVDGVRFTMNGSTIVDTGHLGEITQTVYR